MIPGYRGLSGLPSPRLRFILFEYGSRYTTTTNEIPATPKSPGSVRTQTSDFLVLPTLSRHWVTLHTWRAGCDELIFRIGSLKRDWFYFAVLASLIRLVLLVSDGDT